MLFQERIGNDAGQQRHAAPPIGRGWGERGGSRKASGCTSGRHVAVEIRKSSTSRLLNRTFYNFSTGKRPCVLLFARKPVLLRSWGVRNFFDETLLSLRTRLRSPRSKLLTSEREAETSVPCKKIVLRANVCFRAHPIAQPPERTTSEAFQALQWPCDIHTILNLESCKCARMRSHWWYCALAHLRGGNWLKDRKN